MPSIYTKDLVLKPSTNVDPEKWDESKYDAFVDELCGDREYQKEAIFTALRFLLSGNYTNLRDLADENYRKDPNMQVAYQSWQSMEAKLQLPNILSCSIDLATGTGKSYVLYALAAILLAEGKVDRVLTLCPSRTIELGLMEKFRALATNEDLRATMPDDAKLVAPRVINASETISKGCICVENYHAILQHVGSSIRDSLVGNGQRTLVLNDEAHHVASKANDAKKWKSFLLDQEFDFQYVVGVSGTCYLENDYFVDVVYRYSLREAIEERVVKNVEYVTDAPRTADADEKWQLIYQNHEENKKTLKSKGICPLTIVVTANIRGCEYIAEDLREFLCKQEDISEEQAAAKVLVVTSGKKHQRNVVALATVDNPNSKIEWIISVSMLTEGWDVKNVFQIVPHEERAFKSKLLIAQVLGRGLRVPETWQGQQPIVTIFNHAAWADRIKHLVDEILDIEQRIFSRMIESPHHFDLYDLDYKRYQNEKSYRMRGEYNLFEDGYINLPTETAEEEVTIDIELVSGKPRTKKGRIRHKNFTVQEIAQDMHQRLAQIDEENQSEEDSRYHTNYAIKYSLIFLQKVVGESVKRAHIDPNHIPESSKQKLLSAINVTKRRESKRITYKTEATQLLIINTQERHDISCSAADISTRRNTIFYRSDCKKYLQTDEIEFFDKITDEDEVDFAGSVEQVKNDYFFKSPVNLVIADHKPERMFVRRIIDRENSTAIDGWIKNTDVKFYSIEYAWSKARVRRTAHVKRGNFSPDFFIRQGKNIFVVEIKDDSELQEVSQENIAKHKFSIEHFKRLNGWLKNENQQVHYQFHMLTPDSYNMFFAKLREKELLGYVSDLDAKICTELKIDEPEKKT